MNYTQSIGNITELLCIAKFIELGYECSIPYGNGAKYDFLVDLEDKIIRVQCKSSTQVKKKNGELDDAFRFYTVSQTTNTQKTVRHSYDKTQIDYFATVYNNQVYLIQVEECSTSKNLKLSPPLNNNSAYNKAEDYEIEKMISISRELLNTKQNFLKTTIEDKQKQSEKIYCKKCNKEITQYSKTGLCQDCYKITTRKVERPNRGELKKMIRTIPFTQIAKKYNVSDKAIVKWCIAENLPSKKKDINILTDEEWNKI